MVRGRLYTSQQKSAFFYIGDEDGTEKFCNCAYSDFSPLRYSFPFEEILQHEQPNFPPSAVSVFGFPNTKRIPIPVSLHFYSSRRTKKLCPSTAIIWPSQYCGCPVPPLRRLCELTHLVQRRSGLTAVTSLPLKSRMFRAPRTMAIPSSYSQPKQCDWLPGIATPPSNTISLGVHGVP